MFADEEMTAEVVRSELSDFMEERIEALVDDDQNETVAALSGEYWKPEQVFEFARYAKFWMKDEHEIRIHVRNYHGLEIVRSKSRRELEKQVIQNEISRRQMANWSEKQKIDRERKAEEEKEAEQF
jgi:hypothetical protein